jgi:hypothetical protein
MVMHVAPINLQFAPFERTTFLARHGRPQTFALHVRPLPTPTPYVRSLSCFLVLTGIPSRPTVLALDFPSGPGRRQYSPVRVRDTLCPRPDVHSAWEKRAWCLVQVRGVC